MKKPILIILAVLILLFVLFVMDKIRRDKDKKALETVDRIEAIMKGNAAQPNNNVGANKADKQKNTEDPRGSQYVDLDNGKTIIEEGLTHQSSTGRAFFMKNGKRIWAVKRKRYVELLLETGVLKKSSIKTGEILIKTSGGKTVAAGQESEVMGQLYGNVFTENGKGEAIVWIPELDIESLPDGGRVMSPGRNFRLGLISRAGSTRNMGQTLQADIAATANTLRRTSDPTVRSRLQNYQKSTVRKQMLWAIQNAAQNYIEIPENQKNLRVAALAQLRQLVTGQLAYARQYGINYQLGNMRQMFIEDWAEGNRDAITCRNWINVNKALEDMFGITN